MEIILSEQQESKAILLHGWAVNVAVFEDFVARLPAGTAVWPLPGYPLWPLQTPFTIETAVAALADKIRTPIHLFGWSLGGYVALQLAARHPEKVKTLTLCASFARYSKSEDYPIGFSAEALAKTLAAFKQDYAAQMARFMRLQVLFAPEQQALVNTLLPKITALPVSDRVLETSLAALEAADARALLPDIATPTLILYGKRDATTPPAMAHYLAEHLPCAQTQGFEAATHAPFISHPEACARAVRAFWEAHG